MALTGVFGYVRFRGAVTSNILQSFAADDVLDTVVEALEAAHAIYARRLVIALYSTKEFAHVLRRLTPLMYVPWLRRLGRLEFR